MKAAVGSERRASNVAVGSTVGSGIGGSTLRHRAMAIDA
jgi:hypothetical protein